MKNKDNFFCDLQLQTYQLHQVTKPDLIFICKKKKKKAKNEELTK